ncbi:MAG: hypothetical protein Ta2B_01150 [Termitinemataceae bacterium]|nr:MAG: hypothetical protein Ta2B_01150 [Termitinemataceae bacterium]
MRRDFSDLDTTLYELEQAELETEARRLLRADYPKGNTDRNSDEYEAQIASAYDKVAPLRRKEKTGVDFFDEGRL